MVTDKPSFDVGADLYHRFLAGEETAFEELVALYRNSLTAYIHGFVNDKREAEELAIDAFAELAVCTNYKGRSSLKTYLFAIGRNLALRHVKKYMNTNAIPIDEIINEIGFCERAVEEVYLLEEQKEILRAAMLTLKPEYSEALHLIYFENMSYADTGKIMKKSEKQITNLVHRSKQTLKKLLEDKEVNR